MGGGIIREARRPAGWRAPGPPPRGSAGREDLEPGDGEDLCFLTGDWRIFQRLEGHRWSLDDLLTAAFGAALMGDRTPGQCADIGCGIGSVLLMVAWRFPAARCVGVEAQAVSAAMARRSAQFNGCDARVAVRHGDLRDPATIPEGPVFDLVTGTPPYIPIGKGVVSERVQCGPCRFEMRGGIEGYCEAASRLLAPGGRFAFCLGAGEQPRAEGACRDQGLAVIRRQDVIPRAGRPVLFTLFGVARAGEVDGGPVEEPALVVRDASGTRTAAYRAVRVAMGLPP